MCWILYMKIKYKYLIMGWVNRKKIFVFYFFVIESWFLVRKIIRDVKLLYYSGMDLNFELQVLFYCFNAYKM